MIRQLKAGEPVPSGEPKRYRSGHGYIRLRWRVSAGQYVEVYEHRVTDGVVTHAQHVHHLNEVKHDNAPSNLEPLTAEEHARRHRTIDRAEAVRLYRAGFPTTEVARQLKTHPGNISRMLAEAGIVARRKADYAPTVALDDLRVAHRESTSARQVAERLGVTTPTIYRLMREAGLPPFPPGRPRN